MKKAISIFLYLSLSLACVAESVSFTFKDNSDNEDGFIVEALLDGQWVETQRLDENVTQFYLLDAQLYEGCRVWAYAIDWNGVERRNETPAQSLRKKAPENPMHLKAETSWSVPASGR